MAPSARGSHACKSPLDDTTYEAFSVSCTPALALTAIRSLTPASPRSQLLPCHCTVFPCAGLWSAVLSGGDHHGSLRTPAGGARHGAWPSRATAISAMKMRCRGGRRHARGQNIAHAFSQGEAYEHHQYDSPDPASTPAVWVEQRPQSVCHSAQ